MGKGNTHRRAPPARRLPNTRTRTRQQRPKLSDPAQNSHDLALQLQALGLYAASTLGDGNCLFRALCDQLYGSPKDHLILRKEVCNWMDTHRESYQPFVEDGRHWNQHLSAMRDGGTYGGHLELSAFAHLKRRNVKVIQPGLVYVIDWRTGPNADSEDTQESQFQMDASTSTAASSSSAPSEPSTGRDARRAKRERIREARARKAASASTTSASPTPSSPTVVVDNDDLPAIYVAYHDWEHFSSVRNLAGPHQGIPNVVETPAPPLPLSIPPPSPEIDLSSPRRSRRLSSKTKDPIHTPRSRSPSPSATTDTTSSAPSSVSLQTPPEPASLALPPSLIFKRRSPKRTFDESEEAGSGSEYGRAESKRSRGGVWSTEDEGVDVDSDSGGDKKAHSHPHPPVIKPKRVILLVGKKKKKVVVPEEVGKGSSEWMNNGAGKMDVRGFRELRI